MAIIALTISSKTISSGDFEPFALSNAALEEVLDRLAREAKEGTVVESVVVSTCARTEIYMEASEFHASVERLAGLLAQTLGKTEELIVASARVHYAVGAAEHLYRVACGLESRIIGEGEILSQVREALGTSRARGLVGPILNRIFREAVEVGKRVRSNTKLASGNTSVASAGARMCLEMLGGALGSPRVTVIGAGAIGRETASILLDNGAKVTVLSRRTEAARKIADDLGCESSEFSQFVAVLSQCDGAIFATSSPDALLGPSEYSVISEGRQGRELCVVDLSMPRGVAQELRSETGVSLVDLEGVNARIEAHLGIRMDAVEAAEAHIQSALGRFGSISASKEISPVLSALYKKAEDIRLSELDAFYKRVKLLDPGTQREVDRLTSQVVAKLMHSPATQLKKIVDSGRGVGAIEDLRVLFDL